MEFEWDTAKAEQNIAKHGVPFEYAARVFSTLTVWTARTNVANTTKDGGSLSAKSKGGSL